MVTTPKPFTDMKNHEVQALVQEAVKSAMESALAPLVGELKRIADALESKPPKK